MQTIMQVKSDHQDSPQTAVRIREAKLTDIDEMVELLRQLFALEADFNFNPVLQWRGLFKLICREEGRCVLVAEINNRIVGMCTAQTVISTAEGGPVGWVEDVVVQEEHRGRGVGKRMLLTLEQWAVAQGLLRLQLAADQENKPAWKFYGQQGWQSTQLGVLRKKMG